jgi:hypothetical protein
MGYFLRPQAKQQELISIPAMYYFTHYLCTFALHFLRLFWVSPQIRLALSHLEIPQSLLGNNKISWKSILSNQLGHNPEDNNFQY